MHCVPSLMYDYITCLQAVWGWGGGGGGGGKLWIVNLRCEPGEYKYYIMSCMHVQN